MSSALLPEFPSVAIARGLLSLCLIGTLVGCVAQPPCPGEPDDVMDEGFSALDTAVGDLNRDLNQEGPNGDCRLQKVTTDEQNQ
jgi:hypothetical protein